MEAVGRKSIVPPTTSLLSLQIYKAGLHEANTKALDLQSIIGNRGSITTSENLSFEEYEKLLDLERGKINLYLADPGDLLHIHLAHLPEWFLEKEHTVRIVEFFIAFDRQLSSGKAVIKLPYRDSYDLNGSQEYKKRGLDSPPLVAQLSTISTTSDSVTRKLTARVRGNSFSRARLVSQQVGVVVPEDSKCQKSPTVAAESEGETLAESHLERGNVFELLDSVVIEVLAPDVRLAANVITHLYKLPADLRSLVYGFITHGNNESGPSASVPRNSESGTESQHNLSVTPPSTQKRKSDKDGDEDSDGQKPKDTRRRSRLHSKSRLSKLKYACPFNIKEPARYCVRNEVGGTGELYRSCMGTGWANLHGLLEHLRDHHRPAQCTRCWTILDDQESLDFHKNKLEPRCADFSLLFELREGIDENKWDMVEKALRTPKLKRQGAFIRKSDFEKWLDVWKILFPADLYPDLPEPQHPFYVDPNSVHNSFTSSLETDKRLVIAKAIWDEKAKTATSGITQQEYRASWEEVQQVIREADAIVTNSSQQILQASQSSLPNDKPFSQLPILDSQIPSQPVLESSAYKTTFTDLSDPGARGPATAIADLGTQFPSTQEASTQQAMPVQTSNLAVAAPAMTAATMRHTYTDEEFAELLRRS